MLPPPPPRYVVLPRTTESRINTDRNNIDTKILHVDGCLGSNRILRTVPSNDADSQREQRTYKRSRKTIRADHCSLVRSAPSAWDSSGASSRYDSHCSLSFHQHYLKVPSGFSGYIWLDTKIVLKRWTTA